jgi:KipI family sensor histidine kinase inhibitor
LAVKLRTVGENALMLYVGDASNEQTLAQVQSAVAIIEQVLGDELVDVIPSYASVLILFDPLRSERGAIARRLRGALRNTRTAQNSPMTGRSVVLPVYYAPESGADLEALAARAGLSTQDVIALHTGVEYRVYAIGFAPGFAYLGQVDERIAAPRHATPRPHVPRGSVAIADRQTAVYPDASPGGWNLIGLCPVPMFDRAAPSSNAHVRGANVYMPVSVGDTVRFEPISRERFLALGGTLA